MHAFAPGSLLHLANETSAPHREQLTTQELSDKKQNKKRHDEDLLLMRSTLPI